MRSAAPAGVCLRGRCNLEEIAPPWLHFEIVIRRPIGMAIAALIVYRLRLRGVPFSWRTEIAAWEPPTRFVNRELAGPYYEWAHEQFCEEVGGATRVVDRVHFRPRGGALTQALLVAPDVRRIFTYRQARLLEAFGGQAGDVVVARCLPYALHRPGDGFSSHGSWRSSLHSPSR